MSYSEKITEEYRKKTDRISRVEGVRIEALAGRSVTLFIEKEGLHHYSNQVMAIVSAILLSKWCTQINVVLPEDIVVEIPAYKGKNLKAILEDLIKANDDEIRLQFYEQFQAQTEVVLSIGGGTGIAGEDINVIWIEADGWVAGSGCGQASFQPIQKKTAMNPVGSVFAACVGQSLLFQMLLGLEITTGASKWLSLFDGNCQEGTPDSLQNPAIADNIDFGSILQVGCGAVGSSFDYLLSLTNLSGQLSLIDYDHIEITNLISSLAFRKRDADKSFKKVNVCEAVLKESDIAPFPFDGDYAAYVTKNDLADNYPDLILSFANELNIWSTIQNNYPPIVLHATTTPNWGVNFGRHIPLKEWCIVCRFGVVQSGVRPACAESVVQQTEEKKEVLGVLPFLSPAAAAITLAALIRLNTVTDLPDENFLQIQFKSLAALCFKQQQRTKRDDCPVCSYQYKKLHKAYAARSKYNK